MQLLKDRKASIVTDENMLATPLLLMCVDEFGTDFFQWEPEAFNLECKDAFGTDVPQVNRDKIWSLVTCLTTNLFYISLETFIPVCNVLNGSEAEFRYYDPVTGEEAAWGITEVMLNDPPEKGESPAARFSHEIKRFIGVTLSTEGITTPPPMLAPYVEYDRDPEDRVGVVIGPDENLLQMYQQRQSRERDRINSHVEQQLALLEQQIRQLPLRFGRTSQIDEYLQHARRALIESIQPEELASFRPTFSVL